MDIISTLCDTMSGGNTETFVRNMVNSIKECEPDFKADNYFYDEDNKTLSYEPGTFKVERIVYSYVGLSLIKTVTFDSSADKSVRKVWLHGDKKYIIEDLGLECEQYIDIHGIPHVVGLHDGKTIVFVEAIPVNSVQKERVVRKANISESKYQELRSKSDRELYLAYLDIYHSNELEESLEDSGRI